MPVVAAVVAIECRTTTDTTTTTTILGRFAEDFRILGLIAPSFSRGRAMNGIFLALLAFEQRPQQVLPQTL